MRERLPSGGHGRRGLLGGTCSIVPPYVLEAVELRGDPAQRAMAAALLRTAHDVRERRVAHTPPAAFHGVAESSRAVPEPPDQQVYDAKRSEDLPGVAVTDAPASEDEGVRAAWEGAAATARFLLQTYGIDSLDGQGMTLVSTVHYGRGHNNAFWDGEQMVYGDGDGVVFKPLTGSLSVIGHELAHGLVQHAGGLVYRDQSGALNEHLADVFGVLDVQYAKGQEAHEAEWLIGDGILGDTIDGIALRSMKAPGTAYDDDLIGRDPQPFHMRDFVSTTDDDGGVHINSGIPNHAFYLLALQFGGHAWEKAGRIWFDALQAIRQPHARFSDWAEQTVVSSRERFGAGSLEEQLTRRCWTLVGIDF